MEQQIHIHPMAAHEFGVRVIEGDTITDHHVTVSEQLVDDLGIVDLDEQRLVRESFAFLLEREPAAAISRELDLDSVADRYDDYIPQIRDTVQV